MVDIIWDLWLVLCRWPKKQGLTSGYQILANKYVLVDLYMRSAAVTTFDRETRSGRCTNHDAAENILGSYFSEAVVNDNP